MGQIESTRWVVIACLVLALAIHLAAQTPMMAVNVDTGKLAIFALPEADK
jgi:hypothetical protein